MVQLWELVSAGVFLAVALVSGNNLSACVGTAIGSGVVSRRFGTALGVAGYVVGLLAQGSSMAAAAQALLPHQSDFTASAALFITVAIFIFGIAARVPLSLTMSLVGALAGISVAGRLPLNHAFALTVVTTWFLAPVLAIVATFMLFRVLSTFKPKDVWLTVRIYKALLIGLSFFTAYTLGANTLGLVVAIGAFSPLNISLAVSAAVIGPIYFSRAQLRRVGRDFFSLRYSNALVTLLASTVLVEVATLFAIPLSNTQTLSAGIFGAGVSYRHKYFSSRSFFVVVASWVAAPLLGFAIGLIL
ncbi:MAG: inorganic phosphate transporter [Nitrososphaerota archaeon]|jgi:PiT family inorganic phosphate transporter|nr:inorganic phosphate transporter [Nitrososphaerota archaeon]MDG6937240.1 inorganic phosphate transporter [Nitrososphaerota archaeon]MDG6961965.1 inorganic phosphate transporter [Nitrososphaerota archaeon]MDG6962782.1 inorganic phosphate transporter [Nitrososphaerota archaeon]MDG6970109.1 inorganic phosphate transporter [Nitrososphaerota archaeon]